MIVVGLTGSIAMGKSETARMFEALEIPVFDSDAEVHRLYRQGGAAVAAVAARFPESFMNGNIDRAKLAQAVIHNPAAMAELEAIVHPHIHARQREFLRHQKQLHKKIAVLDIPLLFETGRTDDVDVIVVVSAPASLQRARALARPGMSVEKFEAILARQVPDTEKRARADYVVDSSQGLESARRQVEEIVDTLLAAKGRE
jgi:dephospho-CoA kinase